MISYHFIIYGVFENQQCVMVGSTKRDLKSRSKEYKAYPWFDNRIHYHRILWEGTIQVCDKEQGDFIRAAKETSAITRMGTWWPHGKNQASPLNQVLGGSYKFSDWGESSKIKAALGRIRWIKQNPKQAFLNAQKGGRIGGKKGGLLGGRRMRELYPGIAEVNGHKQGLINAQTGLLKRIGEKGRHTRWHIARNKIDSRCSFCLPEKSL